MSTALLEQLGTGAYRWPMAAIDLGQRFVDYRWSLGTARKRARLCEASGYTFAELERADWEDDIYEINTSAPERQGRPMSAGYLERPVFDRLDQPCDRHRVNSYGVLDRHENLVAYAFVYRCGQLALVSQILGHLAHLEQHVMHLLVTETVHAETGQAGWLVYNRFDSGTAGLQQFKRWLRFKPVEIAWAP